MNTLMQDLKYSVRMFIKQPIVTLVILILLMLGIGANTTIFSFVNATLLRPIQGVASPDQLVTVYTSDYSSGLYGASSFPDYEDFRDQSDVFSGLAAYSRQSILARIGDDFEPLLGQPVTGNYFELLGATAAVGRMLQPEDDGGEPTVTVLSHGFWSRRFGSDPNVVGTTIVMNNRTYTIVGVGSEAFTGLSVDSRPDVWVPITNMGPNMMTRRGNRGLRLVGRLNAGATLAQTNEQLNGIMARLAEVHRANMGTLQAPDKPRPITVVNTTRLGPGMDEQIRQVSWLLMSVVGVVLLIVCVNIASLLLARASARQQEIAVRLSLGAGRGRLVRQLTTEHMLLAVAGGLLALVVTGWTGNIIPGLLPNGDTLNLSFNLDFRMLLFAVGLTVLTGIMFGLIPALQSSNPDLMAYLKSTMEMPSGRMARFGLRNGLVVLQIALSLMLLIGAGLFIRSLSSAASTDVGFNPEQLLVVSMSTRSVFESPEQSEQFYLQLPERIEGITGVKSVTLSSATPLVRWARTVFQFEGYTPQEKEDMELPYNVAGVDHFSTLEMPLIQGRGFTTQDRKGGAPVIVINEEAARRYFQGQDPLGKRVYGMNMQGERLEYEIIGVVGTAKYWAIREDPKSFVYLPYSQDPYANMGLLIRTEGDPIDVIPAVRTVIKNHNKNVPILNITTLEDVIGEKLAMERMITVLSGVFGGIALILAIVGLYGVTTYAVARRTREIGVRMALGAQDQDVLRMVLKHGMAMAGIGVVIGLAGAFAITRFISSMLYDISATDPFTFVAVTILLIVVALVACYLPARRATQVDPMNALRYE